MTKTKAFEKTVNSRRVDFYKHHQIFQKALKEPQNSIKAFYKAFTNELNTFQFYTGASSDYNDPADDTAVSSAVKAFKTVWNDANDLSDKTDVDPDDAALCDMVEITNGRDAAQMVRDMNADSQEYTMPGLDKELAKHPYNIYVLPNGVDDVHQLSYSDIDEYCNDAKEAISEATAQLPEKLDLTNEETEMLYDLVVHEAYNSLVIDLDVKKPLKQIADKFCEVNNPALTGPQWDLVDDMLKDFVTQPMFDDSASDELNDIQNSYAELQAKIEKLL